MKKILVVDDSSTAREIVIRILGSGYEYVRAESGEEALVKIAEVSPDLILLDLLMAGMDGFGVLENLKKSGNTIPVLVLSADIQKTVKTKVLELGAVDLFNKPLDPENLRKHVAAILEKKRGER